MAWVQKIGRSFYTFWYLPGTTKKRKKSFGPGRAGQAAAEAYKKKIEAELAYLKAGLIEYKTTWKKFIKEDWAHSRAQHEPATTKRYKNVVQHFEQIISPKFVQTVTRRDAIKFRDVRADLCKGKLECLLRRSNVNHEMSIMRSVFSYAVNDLKIVSENPFSRIEKLKEKDSRQMIILTDEEIGVCKEHFDQDPDFYPLFLFLLRSGVRIGEAHLLRKKHIDRTAEVVWIQNVKTEVDQKDKFRKIPLTKGVAEVLGWRLRVIDGELLFPPRKNQNYFYKKLKANIQRLAKADLLDKDKFLDETRKDPNVGGPYVLMTIHDLRHTYASHFLAKGGDIRSLQAILGHKRLSTTERYLHLVSTNLKSPIDY